MPLSKKEQEWVNGVASMWIMTPVCTVFFDACCGWQSIDWTHFLSAAMPSVAKYPMAQALFAVAIPVLVAGHVTQTIFSIVTWWDFDPQSLRLQLDRINGGLLTSMYLLYAWSRGALVLLIAVLLVVTFVAIFASTFWTEPKTGQYVLQQLAFRFTAWVLSAVVLTESRTRLLSLSACVTPTYWVSAWWAILQAKQLGARGQLMERFIPSIIICSASVTATAFFEAVIIAAAIDHTPYAGSVRNVGELACGFATGGVLSLLALWCTGDLNCGSGQSAKKFKD